MRGALTAGVEITGVYAERRLTSAYPDDGRRGLRRAHFLIELQIIYTEIVCFF